MKANGAKLLFTAVALAAASGCSNTAPKCSAEETVELVKEIADREMTRQFGSEFAANFSYSLEAIRTQVTHEQTGAHECAAQLAITASNTGATNEAPITYTVELTDAKGEFFVNVYGL